MDSNGNNQRGSRQHDLLASLCRSGRLEDLRHSLFLKHRLLGFTTWVPSYLVKAHGFQMTKMGIVASLPFFAGTVGALLAGWLLDGYFKNYRRHQLIIGEICAAFLSFFYKQRVEESAA